MRNGLLAVILLFVAVLSQGQTVGSEADLLVLGEPAAAMAIAESHPAAAAAISGSWNVRAGPMLLEKIDSGRVGGG